MTDRYDIEVEEYDGETPEVFCVLLNGRQVASSFGTHLEAQAWIDGQLERD